MEEKNEKELIIIRMFDAPSELVFKSWTEPQQVKRWWGPRGYSVPYCTIDLRLDGVFHYCMRSPEGTDFWGKSIYREIDSPERLVFTDSFSDESGNIVSPAQYGLGEDWPMETLVTLTFEEHEGKTKLTLRSLLGPAVSDANIEGAVQGWNESFDKLAELLENPDREVVHTRVFDAPRELVFKMWLDPAHIDQWWGPRNLTTIVDKMDVKPGGSWRIVQRDERGNEYAFNGVYREIVPQERLVQTFEFEGNPGHVLLETVTFEGQDGKTSLTDRAVFQTTEDRDEMLKSGMEKGAAETMDRFAELLKKEK